MANKKLELTENVRAFFQEQKKHISPIKQRFEELGPAQTLSAQTCNQFKEMKKGRGQVVSAVRAGSCATPISKGSQNRSSKNSSTTVTSK